MEENRKSLGSLVDFHTRHKLLFMSHSPKILTELGKLTASGKKYELNNLYIKYLKIMTNIIKLKTTVNKNVNVLHHAVGYFKKVLNLQNVRENRGSMLVAMGFLACLCVLMGLLVLVPSLRGSILEPAVKVLTDGLEYSMTVANAVTNI